MNPYLETPRKVLIPSGMPEELQIHETKKPQRVTYLHEARPPIDKDIPEDSPIVFERAIKNQMPHCSGSRGTSTAGGGAGSSRTQQSFVQE